MLFTWVKKSNPHRNLMILSCPKFQHFSLSVNLQIGSVLCGKKNKCHHSETLNNYFSLRQIKLLEEKVKAHTKKWLGAKRNRIKHLVGRKKIPIENLLGFQKRTELLQHCNPVPGPFPQLGRVTEHIWCDVGKRECQQIEIVARTKRCMIYKNQDNDR